MQTQTIELDCRGQKCPAPILNIAKTVKQLKGQAAVLEIMADDEAFPLDLKSWCRTTKASLLKMSEPQSGVFRASVEIHSLAEKSSQPSASHPVLAAFKPPKVLDYRGLSCPKPILQLAQEFRGLGAQETVEVLADDPAFSLDVRSWGRSSGATIKELPPEGGLLRVLVTRNSITTTGSHEVHRLPAAPQAPNLAAPMPSANELSLKLSGLTAEQRAQKLQALSVLGADTTAAVLLCDDPAFNAELVAWCGANGHTLMSLQNHQGAVTARVSLNATPSRELAVLPKAAPQVSNECTLLVLHNDFEALMASLMTANAAAATGMKVTVFFSFWGVNLLRADTPQNIPAKSAPNFFQRVFRWLMPKGPKRQQLGKLNFGGFGTGIMKGIMDKNQIMGLDGLLESASAQGVTFIVCTTSMTIMGIDQRDIMPLPNIVYGGVASFVDYARTSSVSLVF